MSRTEVIERRVGIGAVSAVAKLLLVLNAILLVGSYFAVPVYQKMHTGEVSNLQFVTLELLAAIDVAAALLVLKGRWRIGLGLIAITSTVWCVGSITMQVQSGRQLSVLSTLVAVAIAYWDVALLGMLMGKVYKPRNSPTPGSPG